MPTRDAFIKRRIEYLESGIKDELEEIGNLKRELLVRQGKWVNDQASYGGNIHPGEKSLNCAPLCAIYDPFLEGEVKE